MKKHFFIAALLLAALAVFTAYGQKGEGTNMGYMHISAEQAKDLMDIETDYVILDVRTEDEFSAGHIPGAALLPVYEVKARAEDELPDKEELILVYCRSGNRSRSAAQTLAELGYTNVKEFGGILDWPYEIEE